MDIKKSKIIVDLKKEEKKLLEKYIDILIEKRNKSIHNAINDFKNFFKEEFELESRPYPINNDKEYYHHAKYGDSIIKLIIIPSKETLVAYQVKMNLIVSLKGYKRTEYIIPINFKFTTPSISINVSEENNKENIDEKIKNIRNKIEELKVRISNENNLNFYYGLVESKKQNEYESLTEILEEIFE
jgi:DNA-directed RNA polymerase subunit L